MAGRFRGKFLKREEWYSICSKHRDYREDCHLCIIGSWHNVYLHKIESFIHDWCYPLWYWNANRPKNKLKFIKQMHAWGFTNFCVAKPTEQVEEKDGKNEC